MNKQTKMGSALAGLVATAALVPMAPADAHTARWSTITSFGVTSYGSANEYALGQISSPKPRCEKWRTVKLYQVRRGPDRRIGVTKSRRNGYWQIKKDMRAGKRYYVKVMRKRFGGTGHRHICKGYVSDPIRFSG